MLLLLCVILSINIVNAQCHNLSVNCNPTYGGYTNITSSCLNEDSSVTVYAYPKTDFRFVCWKQNGIIVSTNNPLTIKMDNQAISYTAHFVYDPASPSNPGSNSVNYETGEIIIDDFIPGNLNSTIASLAAMIGTSNVRKISIFGQMNSFDFGFSMLYPNCEVVDISKTSGYYEVPDFAFGNGHNLKEIHLPSSVTNIGNQAFDGCDSLLALYCYAANPPTVTASSFANTPNKTVIYVPQISLQLYQQANYWNNHTIQAFDSLTSSLVVVLPQIAASGKYRDMTLELRNLSTGQVSNLVVTNSTKYTFTNVIRNTKCNVSVRNKASLTLGKISNINIVSSEDTVVFPSLLEPKGVRVNVTNPNGDLVNDSIDITWYDENGKYLGVEDSITMLSGTKLKFKTSISDKLALIYSIPQDSIIIVGDSGNIIFRQLVPIPKIIVSGYVKDNITGQGIRDVNISIVQKINNKQSKTKIVRSNAIGYYQDTVLNVPAIFGCSQSEYVNQNISVNQFVVENGIAIIDDILMRSATGINAYVDFTYQSSKRIEEDTVIVNYIANPQDIDYTLFNITQNRSIDQVYTQYPRLTILSEVAIGDSIRFTIKDRGNRFVPVTEGVRIDTTGSLHVSFTILEYGKISASFGYSSNHDEVGILYDSNGKRVSQHSYSNLDTLTISDLQNGQYTLISMDKNSAYNGFVNLSRFSDVGLVQDQDYRKDVVNVQSGLISVIHNDTIPHFSDQHINLIDRSNSSFLTDKPSVVAGNYLTLSATVEIPDSNMQRVSNLKLMVDIPQTAAFVANSVMIGNSLVSNYSISGNTITIPFTSVGRNNKIKFCILPTESGSFEANAVIQARESSTTFMTSMSSAHFEVEDITLRIPAQTPKKEINVCGVSAPGAAIEIYDNNTLVGSCTSNQNGVWSTVCPLNNAYNLSSHDIYAKVIVGDSYALSKTQTCIYNKDAKVELSKVTMNHWNSYMKKNYEVVYDFLNHTKPDSYYYYKDKDFDFTIDFTINDTTLVSSVILYVQLHNGEWVAEEAKFDTAIGKWYAKYESSGIIYETDIPISISVDYIADVKYFVDADQLRTNEDCILNIQNTISESDDIDAVLSAMETELLKDIPNTVVVDSLFAELNRYITLSDVPSYVDIADSAQVYQYLDSLNAEFEGDSLIHFVNLALLSIDSLLSNDNVVFSDCSGLTEANMESLGYSKQEMTDSTYFYYLQTDSIYDYVDFVKDIRITIILDSVSGNSGGMMRLPYPNAMKTVFNALDKINKASEVYNDAIEGILDGIDLFEGWLSRCSKSFAEKMGAFKGCGWAMEKEYHDVISKVVYDKQKDEALEAMGELKNARKIEKILNFNGGVLKESLKKLNFLGTLLRLAGNMRELISLYEEIPECEDSSLTDNLANSVIALALEGGAYAIASVTVMDGAITVISTSAAGLIFTGGSSAVPLAASIASFAIKCGVDFAFQQTYEGQVKSLEAKIKAFRCPDDDDDDDDYPKPYPHPDPYVPHSDPTFDPSGFVYEGVFSNRLPGVTASCYYRDSVENIYGDIVDKAIFWDATEYDQENPLVTDTNGFYQWFVPEGLWQVKYEKDGYETTYSEWLPVPPPQLEVNVAMVQNRQPVVSTAHAYIDGIVVEFDKYMKPDLLDTANIHVKVGNTFVPGSIVLLDEEVAYRDTAVRYASKLRFVPDEIFTASQITLIVSNKVKSYADVAMQEAFIQTFTIEQEVNNIIVDSVITVAKGQSTIVTVSTIPTGAAAGRQLIVNMPSNNVASCDSSYYTLDANGQARINIYGRLNGTIGMGLAVENTFATAFVTINVVNQIDAPIIVSQTGTFCQGITYYWRGRTLTKQGVYTDTVKHSGVSDTIYRITLSISPTFFFTESDTILEGTSLAWHGNIFSTAGVFYDSLLSLYGCDSVYQMTLVVGRQYLISETHVMCQGESYLWHGKNLSNAGIYYDSLKTVLGFDSVYVLNLTVNQTYYTRETSTIVEGASLQWHNQSLTTAGIYFDTMQTINGCDSVFEMTLTVGNTYLYSTEANICQGEAFTWRGHTYGNAGIYLDSLLTQLGYDSVYQLILTVNPTYFIQQNVHWPSGKGTYDWHGKSILTSGIYYDSLTTTNTGCDSVYMLDIIFIDPYHFNDTVVICEGDYYDWRNGRYTASGVYFDSLKTADDVDSVYQLNLLVNLVYQFIENDTINKGDTMTWHNLTLYESGVYYDSLISIYGCDSVFELTLCVTEMSSVDYVNENPHTISIVPNPVNKGMTAIIYGNITDVEYVQIVNESGQLVKTYIFTGYPIEIGNIQVPGLYFVKLLSKAGETIVSKFIVK